MPECKRCGECCDGYAGFGMDMIDGHCEMLTFDDDRKAVCGVHNCKPDVCAEYYCEDVGGD